MRVLIDQGFPVYVKEALAALTEIQQIEDSQGLTDLAFVDQASQRGCSAVVLLGERPLMSDRMREALLRSSICAVVTASDEPAEAAESLIRHWRTVMGRIAPGRAIFVSLSQAKVAAI